MLNPFGLVSSLTVLSEIAVQWRDCRCAEFGGMCKRLIHGGRSHHADSQMGAQLRLTLAVLLPGDVEQHLASIDLGDGRHKFAALTVENMTDLSRTHPKY